jgi:hypothetical protein
MATSKALLLELYSGGTLFPDLYGPDIAKVCVNLSALSPANALTQSSHSFYDVEVCHFDSAGKIDPSRKFPAVSFRRFRVAPPELHIITETTHHKQADSRP